MAYDLTATGTPVFASGQFGNAYNPNGGRYSTADAVASSTSYTVEAWVNNTGGTGTVKYAFAAGTSTTIVQLAIAATGKPRLTSGTLVYDTYGTALGTGWHHLAVSKSGSTVRFFIDGVSASSASGSGASMNWPSGFSIGAATSGASNWTGQIDEVRVSNNARYTATFTPSTSPFTVDANTIALYHFEGDGTNGDIAATPPDVPIITQAINTPGNGFFAL